MATKYIVILIMVILRPGYSDIWRFETFKNVSTKQLVAQFPVHSQIKCIVYCSSYFSTDLMSIQDGVCYCVTSYPHFNWTGIEVKLNSIVAKRTDESDCVSKGYDVYPNLGVCIKYHETKTATWEEAKRVCNQDGGYLLNIDTIDKFNTAKGIVNSSQYIVFVGGFTTNWRKGEFYWTRGGGINPIMWKVDEPSPQKDELCLTLALFTGLSSGVNNFPCSKKKSFLCELMLL